MFLMIFLLSSFLPLFFFSYNLTYSSLSFYFFPTRSTLSLPCILLTVSLQFFFSLFHVLHLFLPAILSHPLYLSPRFFFFVLTLYALNILSPSLFIILITSLFFNPAFPLFSVFLIHLSKLSAICFFLRIWIFCLFFHSDPFPLFRILLNFNTPSICQIYVCFFFFHIWIEKSNKIMQIYFKPSFKLIYAPSSTDYFCLKM